MQAIVLRVRVAVTFAAANRKWTCQSDLRDRAGGSLSKATRMWRAR